MKKLLNLFIAVTLATAVTSCGKTTKGKMDGEWKISTVEETNSNLITNNTTTTKVNDAVITRTSTSGSTSNTSTGVVNEANWTIKNRWYMDKNNFNNFFSRYCLLSKINSNYFWKLGLFKEC